MQRLDEGTRAELDLEPYAAVERICEQNDMPMHSGPRCKLCSRTAAETSGVVPCRLCRHFVHEDDPLCPHCHGLPGKPTRIGEGSKMPMLEGLEKMHSPFPLKYLELAPSGRIESTSLSLWLTASAGLTSSLPRRATRASTT